LQTWRIGGQNKFCLGKLIPVERRKRWRKDVRGLIWRKYVHMNVNGKKIPVEMFLGMQGS
jgi:hypothetical protein